ncbi:MaoC/PaaZ C-terminal domain-containing protein [Pseudomonas sp. RIT-PI-AD]|uniref:MaoC family dehydratase n=1 Tax=Pseudomonas sp. RIT-PI-AD TaxID=3035294 RepID=UPI0021D81C57|nr:MaoC/PaaZ C-terminal domain-containing protein [Pseudomonas sp. RIT-PI-AD]
MAIEWRDLPSSPPLPGLFLRAALRRGIHGTTLPTFGLRTQVRVDPMQAKRYREVCGFADTGMLPPTFPHVLAFPLQMKLLTEPDFPFPLLGLVHLSNRIRVIRPLGGEGPFVVSVQANNLQPHEKGALFSLLIRLEDQLGLLWEGESRILCRGAKVPGPIIERPQEDPLELTEIDRWTVPADTGRAYARASGDYNPIHLSAPSAKLFGFPRAIAHGLWSKARALASLSDRLPRAGYVVEVRFQKPLLLPGEARLYASAPAPHGQLSLRGADEVPHMSGNWHQVG